MSPLSKTRLSWSSLSILIAFSVLLVPDRAIACVPNPPDPWFIEELSVDATSLPKEISARSINPKTIAVSNDSTTPLYVVGRLDIGGRHNYEPLPVSLPAGTGPLHRLAGRQVFTWGPGDVAPDKPPVLMWKKEPDPREYLAVEVWPNSVTAGRGSVAEIESLNQTGDSRPVDVAIPQPQRTELILVYDNQRFSVPLTVSYKLNETYDPHSVAQSLRACDRTGPLLTLGFLSLTSIVMLIVIGRAMFRWLLNRT
jgi:hypothetical protein